MKKSLTRGLALACAVIVPGVAACSSTGSVDNPFTRRLTWFSFMSGDDLRQSCAAGETHLRLVHNAQYREDVRVVEILKDEQGHWKLNEQVMQEVNWAEVIIDPDALRAPWTPETFETGLTKEQAQTVSDALATDDAFKPLVGKVPLDSESYFWVGSGCRNGQPWFHAWAYPSQAYKDLNFPAKVEALLPSKRVFAVAQPLDRDYPNQNEHDDKFFETYATDEGVAGRGGIPMIDFK